MSAENVLHCYLDKNFMLTMLLQTPLIEVTPIVSTYVDASPSFIINQINHQSSSQSAGHMQHPVSSLKSDRYPRLPQCIFVQDLILRLVPSHLITFLILNTEFESVLILHFISQQKEVISMIVCVRIRIIFLLLAGFCALCSCLERVCIAVATPIHKLIAPYLLLKRSIISRILF